MLNKDLFVLDPLKNKLINDGVAQLNTSTKTPDGLKIIRHEIQSFVCEGEYARGLQRIIQTYLKNVDDPKQPAVWVSGFFGSGKSHLVKMLSYFWDNFSFEDGITTRQLKILPQEINDQLVELSRYQKLYGSVTIRGMLSDFPSRDFRYSFLQLLLSNLGLPTKLHQFRFYNWCRSEGILEKLSERINEYGKKLEEELDDLYVSKIIPKIIMDLMPGYAETEPQIRDQLGRNFPRVESISQIDFIKTIQKQILPLVSDKIPCILVTLDEVQQFIGSNEDRSHNVQLLAEDLCENFNGRLLLVATGLNALTDTPILQKLTDRFTVTVTLSDKDVETVTRKTVLEKKSSAYPFVNKIMTETMGEVSRLLDGTNYGFVQEDKQFLAADYPILPSTRKFWKRVLQAIDVAGTSGQLRSQLRIVDESIKNVANKQPGEVIPADFIFDQKKQQLIQNAKLLNEQSNIIEEQFSKGDDGKLKARILSVAFLIDLLPREAAQYKLKSDGKTIADLLVDNLREPSDHFRHKVEQMISELVHQDKYLIPIDDEFMLQTRVGSEWEKEFSSQANKIRSDEQKLYEVRQNRILTVLSEKLKTVYVLQGKSRMRRELVLYTGDNKPPVLDKLNLWVRDGWLENENTLMDEVRAEGTDEPLAYLFIQKTRSEELKREIVKMLAAEATLAEKGTPSTPEGDQARKSMETRKKMAAAQVRDLIDGICAEIKVMLAGGSVVDNAELNVNIRTALEAVAARQFPEFAKADHSDWDKAVKKAISGDSQALQVTGFKQEPKDHPMAAELMQFAGHSGKTGKDIRINFLKSPYGWSQDAIDAMLITLTITGHFSTKEEALNQKSISQAVFRVETLIPTAKQKIDIRKLYLVAGIHCQSGNELKCSGEFLRRLDELAESIYGDAPLPEYVNKKLVTELVNLDGNERLLTIHNNSDALKSMFEQWKHDADTIARRLPTWKLLVDLSRYAGHDEASLLIKEEINAIRHERMILVEPDPIQNPLGKLTDWLRSTLNQRKHEYNAIYDEKMPQLQANEYFSKISPEERRRILVKYQLLVKPEIKSYGAQDLLTQLNHISLDAWADKVAALSSKFQQAVDEAILLSAPKAGSYSLPKGTIRNESELEVYLTRLHREISDMLNNGDVILK